jgi:O-antigen/teichoic acid export membrane protein
MRNLQQAYQTLVKDHADYRVLVRFFRRVGSALAILTVVIAYPLSTPVLGTLMGLDAATRAYIALPLAGCALYCYLYGAVSLLRGWFTGEDRTTELGRSVIYKILFLLACWGLLAAVPLPAPVPGVAIAVFLLMAAELCETWYLHHRRNRLLAA